MAKAPIMHWGLPGYTRVPVEYCQPSLVGFEHGAETATATYKLRSGPATLTVINYPTPQMAAAAGKNDLYVHQCGESRARVDRNDSGQFR